MFQSTLRIIVWGCGVLLLTASLLPAQHPPRMPAPIGEPDPADLPAPLRVVREFLDLTQEQLDQYIAHRQEIEESASGVRQELAEAERALHDALAMEEPDPAEVVEAVMVVLVVPVAWVGAVVTAAM